jgi:hypothetical protein
MRLPICLPLWSAITLVLVLAASPACPTPVPLQGVFPLQGVLESSPFANRLQSEMNVLNMTCRLLRQLQPPASRIVAVVFTDVSGGLDHSLRRSCKFETEPIVHIMSYGSRLSLRTSLMLKRAASPRLHARPARPSHHAAAPVFSCCQPSSDLNELSFPPPCNECFEPKPPVSAAGAAKNSA